MMIAGRKPWRMALLGCLPLLAGWLQPALADEPVDAASAQQASPEASPRAGIVKLVNGQAQAQGAGAARPLHSGDAVQASDRIQTGPDSAVSLILRDGTTLMLGPSSSVDLRDFSFNPTTNQGNVLISVLKGTLRVITGLIGKTRPESMKVTTPTSTIGVLGTDFIVEVREETPK